MDLPQPDSDELHQLVSNGVTRGIYRVLYENQGAPLGIHKIRELIGADAGIQQHLDRRLRDLDSFFEITRVRVGRDTAYSLLKRRAVPLNTEGGISKTVRARVLKDQRCMQCGRTPGEDQIRLHVDHKIPQRWGGRNDEENLQALCSECNEGKKDYYSSYDDEAPAILKAFAYEEPHRRIGEALKAAYPNNLRGDLLERIANAKSYQEDWQKRLRELRLLGWQIKASRQNEQGRAVAYYRLEAPAPEWPDGGVRAAIRAIEKARGY